MQFEGFRGKRPASGVFSVERYDYGVFSITGLIGVALTSTPKSEGAAHRAQNLARSRVLKVLGVAA